MKNITATELKEIISHTPDVKLIDVRTSEECNTGMIKGAINIDLMAPGFAEKITDLDQNKPYVVVCQSGGRSSSACGFMEQQGFTNVSNLLGGMFSWDGETV